MKDNELKDTEETKESVVEFDPKEFKKALRKKVKEAGGTKTFLKGTDFLKI